MLYTILGAVITWLVMSAVYGDARTMGMFAGLQVSTYYICMSIFLAFAVCYPNMQILLYFYPKIRYMVRLETAYLENLRSSLFIKFIMTSIYPIKMKWLAYVYALLMVIDLIQSPWPRRIVMVMSLLNIFTGNKPDAAAVL